MASLVRNIYTCGSSQWEQNANLETQDGFKAYLMNYVKPRPLYIYISLSLPLYLRRFRIFVFVRSE